MSVYTIPRCHCCMNFFKQLALATASGSAIFASLHASMRSSSSSNNKVELQECNFGRLGNFLLLYKEGEVEQKRWKSYAELDSSERQLFSLKTRISSQRQREKWRDLVNIIYPERPPHDYLNTSCCLPTS